MNLFITSSPFLKGTDHAFLNPENHFVEWLQEVLPPLPRVLIVASDPERHDLTCQYGMDDILALHNAGIRCSSFHVLDNATADRAAELVAGADLIVLSGGHVPTQNAFFHAIGLRELLRGFGGTLIGISAGSMNMAETVYAHPELPGEAVDPSYQRFIPGLGLTGVQILPHYQEIKDDVLDGLRIFEEIAYPDSFGNTFFVLPDGSYFYQDENQLLLCGESYMIRDGEMHPLTRSGDCLNMADFE